MLGDRGFIIGAWLNAWNSVKTTLGVEFTANRDADGGYPSLNGYALKLKNAANTVTNTLSNTTTAARTWVMPDKDGTLAMTSDITAISGLNVMPNNTFITQLGSPTLEEMALLPHTYSNQMKNISPDIVESLSGSTWVASSLQGTQAIKNLMIGDGVMRNIEIIPSGATGGLRLTWTATSQSILNILYMYMNCAGNNVTLKLESFTNNSWVTVCENAVFNWPGHVSCKHDELRFYSGFPSYSPKVRVSITKTNGTGNPVELGSIFWIGGYPVKVDSTITSDSQNNTIASQSSYAKKFVFYSSSLSSPTIPLSLECDGTDIYFTNSAGVRKKITIV